MRQGGRGGSSCFHGRYPRGRRSYRSRTFEMFGTMSELHKSVRLPQSEWRVHVAALGFDELDRVITPLREMGADAFFLLQHPKGDRAAKALTDGGVNLQGEL